MEYLWSKIYSIKELILVIQTLTKMHDIVKNQDILILNYN